MNFKNKIILAPMAHSLPLEVIPLRGEMSQSDKRVPVLEEKGDRDENFRVQYCFVSGG